MPIPKLKVTDLRREAIDLLKEKAIRRGRLTEEETKVDDTILMENIHLIDEDGYQLCYRRSNSSSSAYDERNARGESESDYLSVEKKIWKVTGSICKAHGFEQLCVCGWIIVCKDIFQQIY